MRRLIFNKKKRRGPSSQPMMRTNKTLKLDKTILRIIRLIEKGTSPKTEG